MRITKYLFVSSETNDYARLDVQDTLHNAAIKDLWDLVREENEEMTASFFSNYPELKREELNLQALELEESTVDFFYEHIIDYDEDKAHGLIKVQE